MSPIFLSLLCHAHKQIWGDICLQWSLAGFIKAIILMCHLASMRQYNACVWEHYERGILKSQTLDSVESIVELTMVLDSIVSPCTPDYMHLAPCNPALATAKDMILSSSVWSGMLSMK